jgi:toxin ParE1/3/4
MKVRFDRAALADISEILDYIESRNPRAAAELLARFEAGAELIGRVPLVGAATQRIDFRRLVVGNYLMVYEVNAEEVIIHYVRHGARKRPWEGE